MSDSRFQIDRLEARCLLSANVDPRLAALVAEYDAYIASGSSDAFQSSDATIIVEDGRVWLEAFFWTDHSDGQRVTQTFADAGFENTSNVPFDETFCLSGWMPITSLQSSFYDATSADEIWALDSMPEPGTIDFVDQPLLDLEAEYRAFLENGSGEFKPSTPSNGVDFLILDGKVGVTIYAKEASAETLAALDSLGFKTDFESSGTFYGWLPMTAASSLPSVAGFLSAHQSYAGLTNEIGRVIDLPVVEVIDTTPLTAPDVAVRATLAPAEWKTGSMFSSTAGKSADDPIDPLDFTIA